MAKDDEIMSQKPIYMLANDLFFASKVVKTAEASDVPARAFDTAERLIQAAREKGPSLVVMDCERLERDAFRLLQEFRADEKLSKVPCIGYLSHTARDLKGQMLAAGAVQVYFRSEFSKQLENLLLRYAGGLPSRL